MSGVSASALGAAGALSADEKRTLLAAAREAITAHLTGRRAERPPATGAVAEKQGAFVTLRRRADGDLRGCVGQIQADVPLVDTVVEMAVAAATRDGRFEPVSGRELPSLSIEISVLSPLTPIRPLEVEVGRHGLMVRYGDRRGLLLPQVPLEHGWDRESFLGYTCGKAGLPADTWRKPGVELLGFTATVFSEEG